MTRARTRPVLRAGFAAATLTLTTLAALPVQPAAAQAPAGPGSAAAATLPELAMDCASGQTDINAADVPELVTAFGLDVPVAERLVAHRPYLRVSDLLVVQGIGPERLAQIESGERGCAVPATTPPPSIDACTGDKLDIQSAPAADLARVLGVSANTARNIVAARPFAALRHVVPERVRGLGKGQQARLAEKACLTPQPVRTATASYRWAYRSQNTTVTRDGASLRLPAGVVDAEGAWASVSEAAPFVSVDGPVADFHIHGEWANGTDTVEVTLPLPGDLSELPAESFAPVVFHAAADGLTIHHGAAVRTTAASITTATTSLSPLSSGAFSRTLLRTTTPPTIKRNQAIIDAMRFWTDTSGDQPSCGSIDPQREVTTGRAIERDALLGRQPVLWCAEATNEGTARWTLANNTGAVLSMEAEGPSGFVGTTPTGNGLLDLAYQSWNSTENSGVEGKNQVDIPPGGAALVRVPAGTENDPVPVGTNGVLALPTFLTKELGALVPANKVKTMYDIMVGCGYSLGASAASVRSSLNCAKTLLLTGGETVLKSAVSIGLVVIDGAITSADTLRINSSAPWDLRLTYFAPPPPIPPSQPTEGSLDNPPPPAPGDAPTPVRLLKVRGSNASYLLTSDGVAHPIPDGGTYICNARRLPVQFEIDPERLSQVAPGGIGEPTGCVDLPQRSLQQGTVAGFLLRKSDGTAYITNSRGQRALVFGNGSFACFARTTPVWDFVTDAELARIPAEPSIAGRACTA